MSRRGLLSFLVAGAVFTAAGVGRGQPSPSGTTPPPPISGTAVGLPDPATGVRPPVVGVTVELLGANGLPLAGMTTTTRAGGAFDFPTLPAGAGNSFSIRFSGTSTEPSGERAVRATTVVASLNPESMQNLGVVVPFVDQEAPPCGPLLVYPVQSSSHQGGLFRRIFRR